MNGDLLTNIICLVASLAAAVAYFILLVKIEAQLEVLDHKVKAEQCNHQLAVQVQEKKAG